MTREAGGSVEVLGACARATVLSAISHVEEDEQKLECSVNTLDAALKTPSSRSCYYSALKQF